MSKPLIKFCENKGRPHTLIFEDKMNVGIIKDKCQLSIPLNGLSTGWESLVKQDYANVIFKDTAQIDSLIERLQKLKSLKEKYDLPMEEMTI